MSIDFDYHGDCLVVYETIETENKCPVCELISEYKKNEIALKNEIESLKSKLKESEENQNE